MTQTSPTASTDSPIHFYEGFAVDPDNRDQFYVIGQSDAGAYGRRPNSSTTTYDDLENIYWRLAEGGYVVDKRHMPLEKKLLVISGPMEDCRLPALTVNPLNGGRRTFSSYEDFENNFSPKGYDFLSIDLYAEWWRGHGAKVGRKINGKIVWKD